MKGIPKNNNFKVINKETGEEKLYKTLQEIATEYNTNYYTVREVYKASTNKKTTQRKLTKLKEQIIITSI